MGLLLLLLLFHPLYCRWLCRQVHSCCSSSHSCGVASRVERLALRDVRNKTSGLRALLSACRGLEQAQ